MGQAANEQRQDEAREEREEARGQPGGHGPEGGQGTEGAGPAGGGGEHGDGRGTGGGSGGRGGGGDDGDDGDAAYRRQVTRRRLLLTGVGVVGLGVAGVAAQQEIKRWWWRMPGNEKPRTEGAVDDTRARWVAASEANWRRANRPADYGIDRVVVHVVQGSAAIAVKVFRDPAHRAAAHYIVSRNGQLTQMIRELDIGYHAGNRQYNERSVGIEHEGWIHRPQDFTDAMYRASARLTAGICHRYGIPADRAHIIGHDEVPGADHKDPGPHWDWNTYMRLVRAQMKVIDTSPGGGTADSVRPPGGTGPLLRGPGPAS
ncbi:peptidoglycan recognition family protein [Streptomyces axinellae]|uniref:N-acetylmuramoyl-L-alanine amidase n=1 Tax=Streptomyces axinellae TaxID=552788 RepID=A0ABN3QNI7_9ACTN